MRSKNLLKKLLKRSNKVAALPVVCLVVIYRESVSRIMGARCRFHPSCSNYALQALKKHGLFSGMPKVVWRILRCNPFNDGGYDPIK